MSSWYERSSERSDSDKERDALDGIYQYYAFIFNGVSRISAVTIADKNDEE